MTEKKEINIKNSGFTFEEYVKIFVQNKRLIIYTTLIGFIFSIVLYFFIIKPVFLSTATIKTTNTMSGVSDLLGGGALPDIGGLEDLAGGGGAAKELALYENILFSRRCIEEAVIRFNLMEVYDQEYMKWMLKIFREDIMSIEVDKVAGTMVIGVYDEEPQRSKEIADFLIYQLDKINIELSIQDAKNNREFLQERYNLVKKDLESAEDSLKSFQVRYGIAPDLTVQAAVKTEIEIEAQVASEEVKLDLLRKILSPDQAEIKNQEEKIVALQKQLAEIQTSSESENLLGLKGKADVVMNFLRLKRDVEIQNKILSIILPMYEQAKIEENRETPSILVIDPPNIPDYKEKPKRAKGVLLVTFIVFAAINAFVIGKYKYKEFRAKLNAK